MILNLLLIWIKFFDRNKRCSCFIEFLVGLELVIARVCVCVCEAVTAI